jgi:hypothetical protein
MRLAASPPSRQDAKLAGQVAISLHELEARPVPPSQTIREHEARLIGQLAEAAHLDGRRFADWPALSIARVDSDRWYPHVLDLRAEVTARPNP